MFTTAELNVCKQGGHGSLKFTTSFIHSLLYYILTYLPAGSVVTRSCALFERIRGRPYCLQGGQGSLKFTPFSVEQVWHVLFSFLSLYSLWVLSCSRYCHVLMGALIAGSVSLLDLPLITNNCINYVECYTC